jgi:hypothetical protein
MRASLQLPLLVFTVVTATTLGACKPKAGDTCETDACGDDKTMLACKHNRFLAVPCEGPKGCKMDGATARCDFSGNKPGTPCDDRFLGKRICKDDKTAVVCLDSKFALSACGGPGGCTSNADLSVKDCDATVAKAGDTCDRTFVTKPACDVDGKEQLECTKQNKWEVQFHCRGPEGCKSEKGETKCDHSVAEPGDPCFPPVPIVCSKDGTQAILCNGTTMFEKPCVGEDGCKPAKEPGGDAMCDQREPSVNFPCETKGRLACAKPKDNDHGTLLECNGTKYAAKKKCAAECVFTRPDKYECK